MSFQSRFNFVGEITIPKSTSKVPFFKELTGGKDKRKMAKMNFGIKESDNNMAFVEAFDGVQKIIKTMNTENEKIEINWEDRFDEDVIDTVANYKKFTVDLGEDCGGRKDFVSTYDAILHLHEWLPKYKGKVAVTGQFVKEAYKGKYFDKFKINNVYAVDSDVKSRLGLTMDVFYNKECVDKADFKTEKKIYINGYISQYINKDEGIKYIPQQVVFNATKYNLENENHKKKYDYKMKYVDIDKKTMVHMLWEVVLLRGAEEVEFTVDMLTKSQKEQYELGIRTLDDFKPRGNILGDKLNEYRLLEPKLTGDFEDGLVDTEMKTSEFEDEIYVPNATEEKLEEVVKKSEEKPKGEEPEVDDPDIDDSDLF